MVVHSEYKQKFSDSSIEDESLLRLIVRFSWFVNQILPIPTKLFGKTRDLLPLVSVDLFISNFLKRQMSFQCKKKLTPKLKSVIYDHPLLASIIVKLKVKILHSIQSTMVDGKVCSALSDTSCSSGSSSKEMNDIEVS